MKSLNQFVQESKQKHFVDVVIKNENGEILVLQRANYMKNFGGKWGVVGGSVEDDENTQEAALREVREETGIADYNIKKVESLNTIKYSNNSTSNVFLFIVKGVPDIKISREHQRYKWITSIDEIKGKWMSEEIKSIIEEIF